MFLVAIDGSDPAWAALEYALSERPDADHAVVHVVDPAAVAYGEYAHRGPEGVIEAKRDEAESLLSEAADRAADRGVSIETAVLVGPPAEEILRYVDEHPIDRVVVGSRGRTGLSRVLLGSVAERLARRAPVPVTIVR